MVISRIISFLEGKAVLYADSENREKFITFLTEHGVHAGISSDRETGGVNVRIRPADVKKIAPILDKSGIIVYIKDVYGFARFCSDNRKRAGVIAGILIFFTLLFMSTGYVMKIEVEGSQLLSRQTVIDDLAEFGISVGTRISEIDKDTCASRFLAKYPEFSWVAINFEGTTATITLKEKDKQDASEDKKCDFLAADGDGVIRSVLVYSGKATVKPGTVVKKGDVLIMGYISGSGLQYEEHPSLRYEGALGSVTAEVKEELSVFVPFTEETVTETVTERSATVISVLGVDFVFGSIPENGAVGSPEKYVEIFGLIEIPVTYRTFDVVSQKTGYTERDETQAGAEAEKRVYRAVAEKLGQAELTEINVAFTVEENGVTAVAKYSCVREIAVPTYIKRTD